MTKPFTLADQIKKEMGNRVLLCSITLIAIILGLTAYDISINIAQLPERLDAQV